MKTKNILFIIAGIIVLFTLMKQCSSEPPKVVTKTITKIVTDTLTLEKIVKVESPVYIERTKTLKGKDSIIYRDTPNDSTITANQYETKVTSNEAEADLTIVSTGEVLDVKGTITYPEKETITTITNNASGLFIYGSVPINNFSSPEIGVMYQFKNKVGVMAGVQYNSITKAPDYKVGLLIKL